MGRQPRWFPPSCQAALPVIITAAWEGEEQALLVFMLFSISPFPSASLVLYFDAVPPTSRSDRTQDFQSSEREPLQLELKQ